MHHLKAYGLQTPECAIKSLELVWIYWSANLFEKSEAVRFFTADVQTPERLPNTVFADAKALCPFGQAGIGMLLHVGGSV